jgi:hypothetical protein
MNELRSGINLEIVNAEGTVLTGHSIKVLQISYGVRNSTSSFCFMMNPCVPWSFRLEPVALVLLNPRNCKIRGRRFEESRSHWFCTHRIIYSSIGNYAGGIHLCLFWPHGQSENKASGPSTRVMLCEGSWDSWSKFRLHSKRIYPEKCPSSFSHRYRWTLASCWYQISALSRQLNLSTFFHTFLTNLYWADHQAFKGNSEGQSIRNDASACSYHGDPTWSL